MNRFKPMDIAKFAIFILVVGFVFIIPVLTLLKMSITGEEGITLANYATIFADPRTNKAIVNTIVISVLSTIIAIVFGSLIAFLVAYTNISNKKIVEILVLSPYIIPSYIITLSWSNILSEKGFINGIIEKMGLPIINIYSVGGIVIVMGICNIPVVYLMVVNMLRKIPKDMELAARTSGYGIVDVLRKITIKQVSPAIASGGILAFLAAIDNFSIPAFLGISSGISVLSTYIYEKAISFGPSSFNIAAALSVILSIIALAGSFVQIKFVAKGSQMESVKEDYSVRVFFSERNVKIINVVLMGVLVIVNIVPLLCMIISSFYGNYGSIFDLSNLTLENYQFVLTNSGVAKAASNSVFLALITCVICIIVGTAIAYMKVRKNSKLASFFESSAALTYALPGIVLALAMIFHWGKFNGVYGSVKILVIAYITRYMVLQIKGSSTALLSVESSLEEAAQISGSNMFNTWRRVIVPLIAKPVLASSFLIFVSSCSELTLSSILASAGTKTIGLTIFNLKQSGDYNLAAAMSSVIVIFVIVAYAASNFLKMERKVKKV
ncbi:iron ABC transporter permease [Peptacetobacter hominis]|uniref:Iron ABC transporter permease n=1 Tax=Peptacetobacter hominis TaxID=2743610 RepID=A0A544QUP5_9FIRM|nr:iron ABC transporter permease [Peptacetobacter hominis]